MSRLPLSRLVPLLALLASAPALAADSHETTLALDGSLEGVTAIHLSNLVGSIEVRGGGAAGRYSLSGRVVAEAASDEEARALAGSIRVRSEREGSSLHLTAEVPVDRHTAFRVPKSEEKSRLSRWLGPLMRRGTVAAEYDGQPVEVGNVKGAVGLSVHLELDLPFDVAVEVDQVAGSVRLERLRGQTRVGIVEGTLEAVQINGSLEARTGRADLDVRSFRGDALTLHTGSGEIALADVVGAKATLRTGSGAVEGNLVKVADLEVESGSGDVKLSEVEPESFDLETGSGTVELAGQLRSTRQGRIHTGSGDVTLRVGTLTSFDLLARTEKGSVKFRDLALEVVEEGQDGTHLRHRSGGRELEVSTGKGDVVVRAL